MSDEEEQLAMEESSRMAGEAIAQIRTVASLGQEPHIIERYAKEMEKAEQACREKMRYRGLVFALGEATPYLGYALCFSYGGILVADGKMHYSNVIQLVCIIHIKISSRIKLSIILRRISEALIFGSWVLGQALAYAPNMNAAVLSAGRLFKILDRVPQFALPGTRPDMAFKVPTSYLVQF